MLNLFQHLINSVSYETLNQVQGDKKAIATQFPRGGRGNLKGGNYGYKESSEESFQEGCEEGRCLQVHCVRPGCLGG